MPAPPPSNLDFQQCIRGAYDDDAGRIRVDAEITASIIAPPGLEVAINATDDNIAIRNSFNNNELLINPDGSINVTTIPSGSSDVNLIQIAGTATAVNNGTANAGTLRVAIASDNSPLAVTQSTSPWVISGTVTANQGGIWNINNISGTISLPTGAATSALQITGNASLTSIDTKTQGNSPTGTVTAVASSASNTTLLAANSSRLGVTFYNKSTSDLYLKAGANASLQTNAVNVVWQDVVNCSAVGNILTKTGADGWDGGARSAQVIAYANDGYVEWVEHDVMKLHMVGLSQDDPDPGFMTIDWAVYNNNGVGQVYENGTNVSAFGTINNGDTIRVSKESNVIKYYNNGVLKYTSLSLPANQDTWVDCSLYTQTGYIDPVINTNNAFDSWSIKINPSGYVEWPFRYVGRIDGLWTAANGFCLVTEYT